MKKIVTIILSLYVISSLHAQNPGDLDPAYGSGGINVIPFLFTNDASDISIMSDDKIITAGSYNSTEDHLLSYKLRTDGTLAPYNVSTWFEYYFDDSENILASMVLPDDKILLTGYYGLGTLHFFIMQLTPDGYLDTDFGDAGILSADIDFIPRSIDVHYGLSGTYNIYIAGSSTDYAIPRILKIDQYGAIANSFGTNGIYDFSTYSGIYTDIYVYSFISDVHIYACGYETTGNNAFISKHDPGTGELISSFADAGSFASTAPNGGKIFASSLVYHSVLSSGTIALFGTYTHDDLDWDICALRLNTSDGSLDSDFGVGGWSTLRVIISNEIIDDAILQQDGKYYFAGNSNFSGNKDFLLGRLQADGYLDLAFGDNGLVLTDIDGDDIAHAIVLNSSQDRIYAGGVSSDENSDRTASLACYYTDFGVGVSEPEANKIDISVYPNPASDIISIDAFAEGIYLLEVYSISGKLVHSTMQTGKNLKINIENLENGMYFLRVSNKNSVQTIKIIKH